MGEIMSQLSQVFLYGEWMSQLSHRRDYFFVFQRYAPDATRETTPTRRRDDLSRALNMARHDMHHP